MGTATAHSKPPPQAEACDYPQPRPPLASASRQLDSCCVAKLLRRAAAASYAVAERWASQAQCRAQSSQWSAGGAPGRAAGGKWPERMSAMAWMSAVSSRTYKLVAPNRLEKGLCR